MESCEKFCKKCKQFKTGFHKDLAKKDGLCTICKDCKKQNTKNWSADNREYSREVSSIWYAANKDKPEVKEKRRSIESAWRKSNPDKRCANQNKRRATKLSATPPWLTDEQNAHINRTYRLCSVISEATGQKYHVDHIVPLQGKDVCGLHVPWNLRVIPAKLNLSKGNRT